MRFLTHNSKELAAQIDIKVLVKQHEEVTAKEPGGIVGAKY